MKAMILAAGRGERMRPLTDTLPKPLLPVAGKPLIEHHIERLAAAGVCELVINQGWLGDKLKAALGDGERWGVQIQWSDEGWPALETGGGITRALPLLGESPFLLVNGDVWTDANPGDLIRTISGYAHLYMVENPEHHPGGDFALENQCLSQQGDEKFTYSGIGIFHPKLFAGCRDEAFRLAPLLREAMDRGAVTGSMLPGSWVDVGTPQRLAALEAYIECRSTTDV